MIKVQRKLIILICILAAVMGSVYFGMCKIASDRANEIFAREMAKQKVLLGTVSADSIKADIWGNVNFTNLVWLDKNGLPVLQVNDGKFKVNPLDIITKSMDLNTIEYIELSNASFFLDFDDNMHLNILSVKQDEKGESLPLTGNKNLNLQGKIPTAEIKLNNCIIAAYHKNRSFILNDVDAVITSRADEYINISLSTEKFGGTLVGEIMQLNGRVDLKKEVPELNCNLSMYNIIPRYMGLGNIDNKADVFVQVSGNLNHIYADGALKFAELDVKPLHFSNVEGNVHYEKGMVYFKNVTGSVFGGSIDGEGDYNIDNRHYNIKMKGYDLLAAAAAKSTKISCKVDLELNMHSDGDPKTVHTYGKFKTDSGTYRLIPFESISGSFSNQNKVLEFDNVVIETKIGNITTEMFKIVDGKLHINDIYLKVPETGEVIKVK